VKILETKAAPNPRRVRIFLAEKGIEIAFEQWDLMDGDLKQASFTNFNPWQRVPVLILDDGTTISESVAICRYFEELQPDPPLMGVGAKGRAIVEMWQRRVELGLLFEIAQVLRHSNPKMAHLEVPQVADWAEANRPKVMTSLSRLNDRLGEAPFLAGESYSIADITMLVAVDFLKAARLRVPLECVHVLRWYDQVSSRPSAVA
jgi:glutathione S-transferase